MGAVVVLILVVLALIVLGPLLHLTLNLLITLGVCMLAGMFAGRIMRGRGYGPVADILLGLVGAILGQFMLGVVGIHLSGLFGGLIAGTIGAVALVYLVRVLGNSKFAR